MRTDEIVSVVGDDVLKDSTSSVYTVPATLTTRAWKPWYRRWPGARILSS